MKTLTWNCDHCKKPIADSKGYVCVSYSDINRHELGLAEWEVRTASQDYLSVTEYLNVPPLAQWQTSHTECDPQLDSHDYWMPVERLRTYERLIQFTAHIMGKTWIDSTNWPVLLRRTIAVNTKETA